MWDSLSAVREHSLLSFDSVLLSKHAGKHKWLGSNKKKWFALIDSGK